MQQPNDNIPKLAFLASKTLAENPDKNPLLEYNNCKRLHCITIPTGIWQRATVNYWLTVIPKVSPVVINPVVTDYLCIDDIINGGFLNFEFEMPQELRYYNVQQLKPKHKTQYRKTKAAIDKSFQMSTLLSAFVHLKSDAIYSIRIVYQKKPNPTDNDLHFARYGAQIPPTVTREFKIYWHRWINMYTLKWKKIQIDERIERSRFHPEWIPAHMFYRTPELVTPEHWESRVNGWLKIQDDRNIILL